MPILDSDLIIQFLRDNDEAKEKVKKLKEKHKVLKTTSLSVAELYLGANLSNNVPKNTRLIEAFLKTLDLLSFTPNDGKVYEVTKDKEVVWELSNYGGSSEACRYAYSYLCGNSATISSEKKMPADRNAPVVNIDNGTLTIRTENMTENINFTIYALNGNIDVSLTCL